MSYSCDASATPFDPTTITDCCETSVAALREMLPYGWKPDILLTLGSGLGSLAELIEGAAVIPYSEVPYMPTSTAPGHHNHFVAGRLNGIDVLCMQGRLHPYDGLSPLEVTYPIRLAARLGASTFIVTNSSGAVETSWHPGQIVLIRDHINFTGQNPLIGPNLADEGPRFNDMTHAYTPHLRDLAHKSAEELGYNLHEGIYLGLTGPSFETPAEIRAFRSLGADLVGMSTVWEVIVAAHCGMDILGLSMITNMAAGVLDKPIDVADIEAAEAAGVHDMAALVRGVLQRL